MPLIAHAVSSRTSRPAIQQHAGETWAGGAADGAAVLCSARFATLTSGLLSGLRPLTEPALPKRAVAETLLQVRPFESGIPFSLSAPRARRPPTMKRAAGSPAACCTTSDERSPSKARDTASGRCSCLRACLLSLTPDSRPGQSLIWMSAPHSSQLPPRSDKSFHAKSRRRELQIVHHRRSSAPGCLPMTNNKMCGSDSKPQCSRRVCFCPCTATAHEYEARKYRTLRGPRKPSVQRVGKAVLNSRPPQVTLPSELGAVNLCLCGRARFRTPLRHRCLSRLGKPISRRTS